VNSETVITNIAKKTKFHEEPHGVAKEHGSKHSMFYSLPFLAVLGGNVTDPRAEYIQQVRTLVPAQYNIPTC